MEKIVTTLVMTLYKGEKKNLPQGRSHWNWNTLYIKRPAFTSTSTFMDLNTNQNIHKFNWHSLNLTTSHIHLLKLTTSPKFTVSNLLPSNSIHTLSTSLTSTLTWYYVHFNMILRSLSHQYPRTHITQQMEGEIHCKSGGKTRSWGRLSFGAFRICICKLCPQVWS